MRLEIRFENGRRAEALILAANSREMRVVVQDSGDTEEWQKFDGAWRDEGGTPIEIEAFLAIDGADCSSFCSTLTYGAAVASASCN